MNNIQTDQNTEWSISLLKAQRVSYSIAKKVHGFETINIYISLFISFIFILLGNVIKSDTKVIISGVAILFSILSIGYEKNKTCEGAKIQEMFDCELFKLPWNSILCGRKVETEKIVKLKDKYKLYDIYNWYSKEITFDLPENTAILLCQYSNIVWDIELRKMFKSVVIVSSIIVYTILTAIFIIRDETLINFVYALLPTISFTKYVYTIIKNTNDLISEKMQLENKISRALKALSKGKSIKNGFLRTIQDSIFILRKSSLKIPNWYHNRNKKIFENNIDESIRLQKSFLGG